MSNIDHFVGKNIEFLAGVDNLEDYAEPNMRARVIGWSDMGDGCIVVSLDYSDFDEYNKKFESRNYFDRNGTPCLSAREAGYYKVKDHIFMEASTVDDIIRCIDDRYTKLHRLYKSSVFDGNYSDWLESIAAKHFNIG